MIDIHTHILFNVDDGAKNVEDSIKLLNEAKEVGFEIIICTSHYIEGFYDVKCNEREKKIIELNKKKESDVEIDIGNEIFFSNNIISLINENKAATLNNSRYVLFELPFNVEPLYLMDSIFKIQSNNLIPILAHPERYTYFYKNLEMYKKIADKGVLFQLNFGSFIGQYGKKAKIIAEKLLKSNFAYFLASDVHRPNTIYKNIPIVLDKLNRLVGKEKVNQLTNINPGLVIENKEIKIEKYLPIKLNIIEKKLLKLC